jgi:hypothetical protein
MATDPAQYVRQLDLSGIPRSVSEMAAQPREVFDETKDQAQVVGSGIFAFEQGVTREVREAISDSALLAQLVANKRANANLDPLVWFREYFDVLTNVGWTIQSAEFSDYSTSGTAAEVHEKVIEVMTAILTPGSTGLAIIAASVNALKAMKPDSPWLVLFSRQSQRAKIARFQVGFVEKEEGADVYVDLIATLVEARANLTQVLLLKFKEEHAVFRANAGRVSINRASLVKLGPVIREKTQAYQADYVSGLLDLGD